MPLFLVRVEGRRVAVLASGLPFVVLASRASFPSHISHFQIVPTGFTISRTLLLFDNCSFFNRLLRVRRSSFDSSSCYQDRVDLRARVGTVDVCLASVVRGLTSWTLAGVPPLSDLPAWSCHVSTERSRTTDVVKHCSCMTWSTCKRRGSAGTHGEDKERRHGSCQGVAAECATWSSTRRFCCRRAVPVQSVVVVRG